MKSKNNCVVYSLSGKKYNTKSKLADALNYVLEYHRWPFLKNFWSRQLVGIKPSFADKCKKNDPLFNLLNSVGGSLKRKHISAFICDTSNRHKNISSNALEQIRESYCDFLENYVKELPIFMLDGINGSYESTSKVKGKEIYLGGELPHLDGLILLSTHFEHKLCGITGSIYNLGAGLASKRGKIKQHTTSKPQVNVNKCYSCKRCMHACPVNAISMQDNHVVINEKKCIDCGRCVEIARRCGISYHWNATPEHFQSLMTQYAAATLKVLSTKAIFINIIPGENQNITGVLIAKDPLALDRASHTISKELKLFPKSKLAMMENYLESAEKLDIGRQEFQLHEIAY